MLKRDRFAYLIRAKRFGYTDALPLRRTQCVRGEALSAANQKRLNAFQIHYAQYVFGMLSAMVGAWDSFGTYAKSLSHFIH